MVCINLGFPAVNHDFVGAIMCPHLVITVFPKMIEGTIFQFGQIKDMWSDQSSHKMPTPKCHMANASIITDEAGFNVWITQF